MDLTAEARSRPRQPSRPDPGEYEKDELKPAGEQRCSGVEAEPGLPAGPERGGFPDEQQRE
eukprot:9228463-Karenia_brevis.AAC.1